VASPEGAAVADASLPSRSSLRFQVLHHERRLICRYGSAVDPAIGGEHTKHRHVIRTDRASHGLADLALTGAERSDQDGNQSLGDLAACKGPAIGLLDAAGEMTEVSGHHPDPTVFKPVAETVEAAHNSSSV